MTVQSNAQELLRLIKENWLLSVTVVAIIIILVLAANWVFYPSIELTAAQATDDMEKALDKAITLNINDYSLWYKSIIILQGSRRC
jgi:hypothetical protein